VTPPVLELTEYETRAFPEDALTPTVGERLWRTYGAQVRVAPPSFMNGRRWMLTAQGWVGSIPLGDGRTLALRPKVPLDNLFGMLAYAYRLRSFHVLEGVTPCATLAAFYERLAHILARRVVDRARAGLYRAYVPRTEALAYVAGRLDVRRMARQPAAVALPCRYEVHTLDVAENQILAWTLHRILRSGLCTDRVLPTVRRAYRAVADAVTLTPCAARDCVGRSYSRLNRDYEALHALCRFFLEHSGPEHRAGDRVVTPFLVDMARLYELFVAQWLKRHLPPERVRVVAQARVPVGPSHHFAVDLTLYDATTGRVRAVLDTKYKAPATPAAEDVAQVVAYAEAQRCRDAVLVYPVPLASPLDARVGDIRVRSLTFALAGDLRAAGADFAQALGLEPYHKERTNV
jgi:5-methylcytosine-specific restriction enzyme subunit McrC